MRPPVPLIGLLLAAAPGVAWSQACCTATGAGEFGVVGRCRTGVLTALLSYEHGVGSYDERGRFETLEDAQVDDVVVAIGGGWRIFSRDLQVHGSLPMRVQRRALAGVQASSSAGLGDAGAGVRYTLLHDMMLGIGHDLTPFLDLYLLGRVPTGRAPEAGLLRSGADVMGEGSYALGGGVKVIKFLLAQHALVLATTYSHRFERTIDDSPDDSPDDRLTGPTISRRFAPGSSLELRLGYVHVHDLWWSAGLDARLRITAQAREQGHLVPESETRRLRVGGYVSHMIVLPWWEVSVSAWLDPWWQGGAVNQPFVGPTLALALQRNFP